MQIIRLDNFDVLCTDIARMVKFYHELLGLPLYLPYQPGQEWAVVDVGNAQIWFFESKTGEHATRRTHIYADNPPGIDSFAFEVEDFDAAHAELTSLGIEWGAPDVMHLEPAPGAWYRYRPFYDPEGNKMYLLQSHSRRNPASLRHPDGQAAEANSADDGANS